MSDTLITQGFNYSTLPTDIADTARAVADRIRDRHKRQIECIIEAGRDLLEIKELLGYGQFLKWLHAEFPGAERTARNYMSAAQQFADRSAFIADLPPNEVYLLAAPSTPSRVRDTVVSRLEAGERIEPVELRTLIRDAKEADRRDKAEAQMSPQQRKTRAQKRAEEERREEERRIRREAEERQVVKAANSLASLLGPALPEFLQQIKAAESKGIGLRTIVNQLERKVD